MPPPPPPPPAPPAKASNRGVSKPPGTYWCTFCNVDFQRKFDWKRHEDEFHERYKRYPCPKCNRIFWGANTFNQHHKDAHGCTTCSHAIHVVRYTKRKRAWYVFCVVVACLALPSFPPALLSQLLEGQVLCDGQTQAAPMKPISYCISATGKLTVSQGHAASAAVSSRAVTATLTMSPVTTKMAATSHTGTTPSSSTAFCTSH